MSGSSKLFRMGLPILIGVLVLVVAIARVGAGDPDDPAVDQPAPGDERQVEQIAIDQIQIHIAESYPVQVFVEVTGTLPDPCWVPQEPTIDEDGDRFVVEIFAERDPAQMCAQVIQDYQENVALGSPGPGSYVIDVNGVEQSFEIQ